jgi:hypothetical protein
MKPIRTLLAALALALVAAPGASAAPRPTPSPPSVRLDAPGSAPAKGSRLTVGVQPATATAPDARAHFDFHLAAGQVVTDHLAVFNYSAKPVSLRLYARDALTTSGGGLDVQHYETQPADVGGWIALGAPAVRLAPRTRVIVPFQLGVPYKATPGDHTGAVVAALTTSSRSADGRTVEVENRVGLRVYLRVAGTVTPRLAIDHLRAKARGRWAPLGERPVRVSFLLRNTGNVRLGARGRVAVVDAFGRTVATAPVTGDVLLPGSTVPFSVRLPAVRATVRMTAWVTVEPLRLAGDSGGPLSLVTASTTFTAVPAGPVAALVALVLGTVALLRRRRTRALRAGRHRRAVAPPRHAAREGVPVAMVGLGLAVAVALVALARPALAAPATGPWAATLSPAKGADDTPIEVTTSGGCPRPATNVVARVFGAGFPAEGVNVVGNTSANVRADVPFRMPLVVTLRDVARDQPSVVTLRGTYRIDVVCRTARDPKPLGVYSVALAFASPTSWVAAKPVSTARGPVESPAPDAADGQSGAGTGPAAGAPNGGPGAPRATARNGAVPGVPGLPASSAAAPRTRHTRIPYVPIGLGGLAVAAAFLAGRHRGTGRGTALRPAQGEMHP